jgi:hypothetical protein
MLSAAATATATTTATTTANDDQHPPQTQTKEKYKDLPGVVSFRVGARHCMHKVLVD